MADRSHLYLAVYDVSEDRERERVAKLLEACGVRIQKSVFEIRANRALRSRLLRQVAALNLASGFVVLYRIDETAKRDRVGVAESNPLADANHAWQL